MAAPTLQHAAFILLALAIAGVWCPLTLPGRVPLWLALYAAAVAAALSAGVVDLRGGVALALLAALGWMAQRGSGRVAAGSTVLAGLLALALALHLVPGFDNPQLLQDVQFRPSAAPFTLHANFDKGSAGLLLLVCFAPRWRGCREAKTALPATITAAVLTTLVVLGLAWALGVIAPEKGWPRPPGVPQAVLVFLAVNLFFTCVAEEAFFRGLLQERLRRALPGSRGGRALAVLGSALLFGLAHLAGGPQHALLAATAGLGYALAFARTGTVEAAILTHFTVNAVHVLAFTYPRMA